LKEFLTQHRSEADIPVSGECLHIFECCRDKIDRSDFVQFVAERFPNCACETCSVSSHSPGPVCDEEVLVSVVSDPSKAHGEPPKILPTVVDRLSGGFSANRLNFTTQRDVDELGESLAESRKLKGKIAEYLGVICLDTSALRGVHSDGARNYAIYDTAVENNVSHAEVFQTEHPIRGTENYKKKRAVARDGFLQSVLHDQNIINPGVIFS
jgi:hypothetical protein